MEVQQRIGPYEVVRELGRGGMGIVYLAREPEDGTLVALKVLPDSALSDKRALERFRREAATVMKVRHPNVVPIYSVGRAGDVWFIAMMYVEGTSLDKLIDDRQVVRTSRADDRTMLVSEQPSPEPEEIGPVQEPLAQQAAEEKVGPPISWLGPNPLSEVGPPISRLAQDLEIEEGTRSTEPSWIYRSVVIVETMARALDYVHSQGIVHRDVKPANIIIDRTGQAWLADFGLVRDLLGRPEPRTNEIMGTFQYMAPEQAGRNRYHADGRCDLYALGVTLYELVTLERPFDGDDPGKIVRAAARTKPVPPRRLNPKLTKEFERVILKAMHRNPDRRYQTGQALADDLERLRTVGMEPPPKTRILGTLRRVVGGSPRLAAAVILLVLVILGLAGICVKGALDGRRRLLDCRAQAERAFERGDYQAAADGYRLYLSLGGGDAGPVQERLKACQEAIARLPK